jgi:hypothetical protein
MVAWLFPPAKLDIHAGVTEPVRKRRAHEQVIHPKTGTPIVAASEREIPISVDALLGMNAPEGIDPAASEYFRISLATLWKINCIAHPPPRHHRVNWCWDDGVVAAKDGRRTLFQQELAVADQTTKTQLVVELWARRRITIGKIETPDSRPFTSASI